MMRRWLYGILLAALLPGCSGWGTTVTASDACRNMMKQRLPAATLTNFASDSNSTIREILSGKQYYIVSTVDVNGFPNKFYCMVAQTTPGQWKILHFEFEPK